MTHSTTQPIGVRSSGPSLIIVARRVYFYLVALVSLIAGFAAFNTLVGALVELWLSARAGGIGESSFLRERIAISGGILLVAVPMFLIHWALAQRLQREPDEQRSAWRKLFLYVGSGVFVGYALVQAHTLLDNVVLLALGDTTRSTTFWESDWLRTIIILLSSVLLYVYLRVVAFRDGDYGQEIGAAGSIRRLYQVIAGLVGIGLLIGGTSEIVRIILDALFSISVLEMDSLYQRFTLASAIATLLVGAVVAWLNWRFWSNITDRHPTEAQTALRRFYLYAAVVVGALVTLIPAGGIVRDLLLRIFGVIGWDEVGFLIEDLIDSLAIVPAGIFVWYWHRRVLYREAEEFGESPQGATIRRIYNYAVAATGLGLLWFGASNTVQALLDRFLVAGGAVGGFIWAETLATGLSLLIFGAPLWAIHWSAGQSVAQQDDAEGAAERTSGPRRVYLYGVALVGALLILFYLARVAYRILLLVLGDPDAALFSTETASEIAISIISAALWVIHLLAIRGDGQMAALTPEPEVAEPAVAGAPPTVVLEPVDARAALEQRIARLEAELAVARAELDALAGGEGAV